MDCTTKKWRKDLVIKLIASPRCALAIYIDYTKLLATTNQYKYLYYCELMYLELLKIIIAFNEKAFLVQHNPVAIKINQRCFLTKLVFTKSTL